MVSKLKRTVILYSHGAYKLIQRKGPKLNYLPEKKAFIEKVKLKF